MSKPDVLPQSCPPRGLARVVESLKLNDVMRGRKGRLKMAAFYGRQVRIWSAEWGAWWRPNGCGYTRNFDEAGVYDFSDAYGRTYHCGPEKKIEYFAEPGPRVEAIT